LLVVQVEQESLQIIRQEVVEVLDLQVLEKAVVVVALTVFAVVAVADQMAAVQRLAVRAVALQILAVLEVMVQAVQVVALRAQMVWVVLPRLILVRAVVVRAAAVITVVLAQLLRYGHQLMVLEAVVVPELVLHPQRAAQVQHTVVAVARPLQVVQVVKASSF
jgi:hypothetical protein